MEKKIKNGFYRTCSGSGNPKIILVFSGKYAEYPKKKYHSEWKGIEYKYWDFEEQKVYQFNEYWFGYIESLVSAILTSSELESIRHKFQQRLERSRSEQDNFNSILDILSAKKSSTPADIREAYADKDGRMGSSQR